MKQKCDNCGADVNLFAALNADGKYTPDTQHRCGYCLEDDKSMKHIGGKWVKYNSDRNIDDFKGGGR